MYLVDATLYTGQHMQSLVVETLEGAIALVRDLRLRTMVETALVINTTTGEVEHEARNAAATWRR